MKDRKGPVELNQDFLQFLVKTTMGDTFLDTIDGDPTKGKLKPNMNKKDSSAFNELENATQEMTFNEIQRFSSTLVLPQHLRNNSNYYPFVNSLYTHKLRNQIIQSKRNAADEFINFKAEFEHYDNPRTPYNTPVTSYPSTPQADSKFHPISLTTKEQKKPHDSKPILQEQDTKFGNRFSPLTFDINDKKRAPLPSISRFLAD